MRDQHIEAGRSPLSQDVIVVDASNVAWNGGSFQRGDRPRLSNLARMIALLQEAGYRVEAICNASLRHQIDDKDGLEELLRDRTVLEAPALMDADRFIVKRALSLNAHIVTRDTYRNQDAALQDRIRAAQVAYMIFDDAIHLEPDPRAVPSTLEAESTSAVQ
jgi:hypothetical protein